MPVQTARTIGDNRAFVTPRRTSAQRRVIGLNGHPTNALHLAALAKLEVAQIRETLYWTNWPDGAPGEIVAACTANALDLLMVIHTPPAQYTGIGQRDAGTPVLAALLGERAAAWPGVSWQIMNEMDGNDGFNGGWFDAAGQTTQLQRGQWYGAVLAACGAAIRAADKTAKVIGGGIALQPDDFVRGILQTCPRGLFDALAVHAYGSPDIGQFRDKSMAVRAIDAGIPLWCTEFGSKLSDQAAQAAELQTVFDDNDANFRYDRCYLYALEDNTEGYGILVGANFRQAANLVAGRGAI